MNSRQEKLLSLLKKSNKKLTVNDISKTFAVSRRTVFNDLNYLDYLLETSGYNLVRLDDGVLLKKDDSNKRQEIDIVDFYSSNRRYDLFKNILFSHELNVDDLSDKLFVSESTILNDINYINENYIKDLPASLLISNNELYIDGDEPIIQNLYVRFNELIFKKLRLMLIESKDLYRNYYFFLSDVYGDQLVKKVKSVLYLYLTNNSQVLAEYYFDNIINYLIVLVYRKTYLNEVENNENNNSLVKFQDADDILKMVECNFGIVFSETEVDYFYDILRANNIKVKNKYDKNAVEDLVEVFLKSSSELLKLDLSKDSILVEQLNRHFSSMIDRAKNNIKIDNPFIDEIKNEYTTLFNTIWMVVIMNRGIFDFDLNDDEIGLLTIYLQSSLDRNKIVQKVMLHIESRYYDTSFIVNRIEQVLPAVEIEVLEGKVDLSKINSDLIITTSDNITFGNIPFVKITPVVTEIDLKNISEKYNSTIFKNTKYKQLNDKHKILDIINNYFRPEFIHFNKNFSNRDEMMKFALDDMVEKDIVDKNYVESIFAREKMGSTALNYMISTPHGNPKFVNDSCIYTVINSKHVQWEDDNVNIMFMMNISENDIKNLRTLFNFIYEMSQDKKLIDELIKTQNYREFIDAIRRTILW